MPVRGQLHETKVREVEVAHRRLARVVELVEEEERLAEVILRERQHIPLPLNLKKHGEQFSDQTPLKIHYTVKSLQNALECTGTAQWV